MMDSSPEQTVRCQGLDPESPETWPEQAASRRRGVRIPTGSLVYVTFKKGGVYRCPMRNIGADGLCLKWPDAPLRAGDEVKLLFLAPNAAAAQRTALVKWRSPAQLGLVFTQPTAGQGVCGE
jgi:hypothetical protein